MSYIFFINKKNTIKQTIHTKIIKQIIPKTKIKQTIHTNLIKQNNNNLTIIKYENLNKNEIEQINNIWHTSFPELNDNTPLDMGFFKNSLLWLIKENDKIIGYVCILESIDFVDYLSEMGIKNSELYSLKNWNGIFINNLCILPKYRKKGIANKLINIIEKWTVNNKKDYLHLLVNSDNEPAYKLYLKNKYKIDQENLNPETNIKVYTMIKYLNNNL